MSCTTLANGTDCTGRSMYCATPPTVNVVSSSVPSRDRENTSSQLGLCPLGIDRANEAVAAEREAATESRQLLGGPNADPIHPTPASSVARMVSVSATPAIKSSTRLNGL